MLGPRLDLFHQQEDAPGAAFWHPRGAILYRVIEDYIRKEMRCAGFREVRTPQLLARSLWERSGHWNKFRNNMFVFSEGERSFALKPMSCPGHIQLFRQQAASHHDLPVRVCEFGACHRYEPAGSLHGLTRSRAFTQDDAHVFCLPEHINGEVTRFCELLRRVYARFGFSDFLVCLSTRPAVRAGSDEVWDRAEALLAGAAEVAGLECREQPGEGAFYGPKLEFHLQDREGRHWQCGTIQIDFVLPERLGAEYVSAEGVRLRPVMIHQAVLGSLERFIAILLEHHRGQLPFWLAPDQVAIAPVGRAQQEYAQDVASAFDAAGVRCVVLEADETLSRRVLLARERGIPVFVTAGAKEVATNSVAVRERDGSVMRRSVAEAVEWSKSLEP
jgi:threonyl-tRNA synthetase